MSRVKQNNQAVIETLETRTLMSAALGISQMPFEGGTQLRITGTTGNDQITVKQTASGLTVANGTWTKTVAGSFNSLWINGQAGNNSVIIDPSVTINATVFGGGVNDSLVAGSGNDTLYGGTGKNVLKAGAGNDTLVSIGSTSDTLVGGAGLDSFWTDNSSAEKIQNVSAADANSGAVHRVGGYVNAPVVNAKKNAKTKAVVATTNIAEPAVDAGVSYTSFSNDPIFAAAGPSANDVFQGEVGDCYFLAVLSSTAKVDPARIQQSVLDLGDGTVIVQLNQNGKSVYVHEDESLPVYSDGSLAYAGLGAQNSTWVGLMEKAWTYVRTNAASYDAIDAGWMDEAYSALGAAKVTSTYAASSATSLLTLIQKDLTAGQGVTYATDAAPAGSGLIEDHAYTVISVGTSASGAVTSLTLRNPWGVGADGTGNGYVTVTAAQALAAFTGMVAANV
ncbi:MAG TPA: C2 family cysteine protease [Tepidisphaeraceae bacterium]|jgi:hypothetical protein|nr:C2 family cysteine protease [Tepidisphaeraceae bacterium]